MAEKITTIIFDLGGVYLNRGLWIAEEKFSKKYGVPMKQIVASLIKKNYKDYFSGSISEKKYLTTFLKDIGVEEDWKTISKEIVSSFEPQPGMRELVKKLRGTYKIGLLSDQTREWWPYLDEKHKSSDNFDFTIISYNTGFHKPQTEMYELAVKKSGCRPNEVLFIDDLKHNLGPAKCLGMKTLLFENPEQLKRDLKKLGV